MKVYQTDFITNEFSHELDAVESPLEPGVFLIPAHCTTTPPPTVDRFEKAVLVNGVWEIVEDFRGVDIYSKKTGEKNVQRGLGMISDEWTIDEPGPFDDWENEGWVTDENAKELADPNSEKSMRAALSLEAQALLDKSDKVVLRCAEKGAPAPQSWLAYRDKLRDVVRGVSADVPDTPDYP